jgi:hypothetical protein
MVALLRKLRAGMRERLAFVRKFMIERLQRYVDVAALGCFPASSLRPKSLLRGTPEQTPQYGLKEQLQRVADDTPYHMAIHGRRMRQFPLQYSMKTSGNSTQITGANPT